MRWPVFLVIACIGLALRLPQLGARPMHTDEAVNAYIVGQTLAGGGFPYDSKDRHGPALAAFALPIAKLQGAKSFADLTEPELRLTPVLAGTVTILLFGAAVEFFQFIPCVIAALLFALAPLPVYYDRYFIHESLFVAATFGLIVTGWRTWNRGSARQGALAGGCAALMLASKETAVLHFAALGVAALCILIWHRQKISLDMRKRRDLLAAVGAFVALTLLLFTRFGNGWDTLSALLHAIPNLLARASGEGHQKPFWYYGGLLIVDWSGRTICALAAIGLVQVARLRYPSPYRFLALYSILVAGIYSLIPYKTPWLALNLWLPIALFAGRAAASIWQIRSDTPYLRVLRPVLVVLLTAAISMAIFRDTRRRVFREPAEETNPYAYAHTSEDLLGLPAEIELISRQNAIASPRIAVIAADPWPLPWYLRHLPQTGFWQPGQQVGPADFYVTDMNAAQVYRDRLKDLHPDFFGVRPGVLILLWSPPPK